MVRDMTPTGRLTFEARIAALGVALITNSADLTQAVAAIASTNTAKVPLQIVDAAVQAGASQ